VHWSFSPDFGPGKVGQQVDAIFAFGGFQGIA
jgi:hypothetical protein